MMSLKEIDFQINANITALQTFKPTSTYKHKSVCKLILSYACFFFNFFVFFSRV